MGIDISGANGNIDWQQVANTGLVNFVFAKATEGLTFVDAQFKKNWQSIKDNGWIRGAYHFGRDGNDPIQEADHFISTVGDLDAGDLLVLDIETGSLKGTQFTDWVIAWCNRVVSKTNHIPIIYTGSFWTGVAPTSTKDVIDQLSRYPLWLAAYVANPDKWVPMIWKQVGWKIWQVSGDVAPPGYSVLHLPGVHGNIDKDFFTGSLDDLKAFAVSLYTAPNSEENTETPPPEQNQDDGAGWEVVK